MEKFWAVILIFVVVAAAGLMYVNQVYIPQKETQMAMAETANQTLTAVKLEVGDDSTPSVVKGDRVVADVNYYCSEGSSISIYINGSEFIKETDNINDKINTGKFYSKTLKKVDGIIEEIRYKEI